MNKDTSDTNSLTNSLGNTSSNNNNNSSNNNNSNNISQSNLSNVKGTNVQVAVRCRPLTTDEKRSGQPSVVACDAENKSVKVAYGPTGKKITKNFTFDKVFGAYSRQEEVFNSIVKPIVDEALAGFNCTIFAYGQTGTGKTHTMEGDIFSEDDAGIVPRSVKHILDILELSMTEFTIRVSFLELYNEELQDLLNTSGDKKLKLCEDVKRGVICQNLEEITVLTVSDIFEILQRGIKQRQTAATLCNKNSSRSHSIFTMKIMIKECNVEGEEVVRNGQLNLVDLAGSECVGRSGAKDDRAREAGSINQSLLTLGRVITALVDHHGHVPYRDSKLTRLLQESLGGKAKTLIIATLSSAQAAVEETLSTLDYASRAKNIKNQPMANQKLIKKVVMKEYCAEIEFLKNQLQMTREKNGVYLEPGEFYAMEARLNAQESQLAECEAALKSRTEEVKTLKTDNLELISKVEAAEIEVKHLQEEDIKLRQQVEEIKEELHETALNLKATQAVVSEQVVTEKVLYQTGYEIQDDLKARHVDLEKLVEKVEKLTEQESLRLATVHKFIDDLNKTNLTLLEEITAFSSESNEHSTMLCQGVDQIILRGKDTCTSLQESIDQALKVLLGDAEAARDSMTQSCSSLKLHLQGTNGNVEKTLRSLGQELSNWLGEADVNLKQGRKHLLDQQAQILSLAEKLKDQRATLTAESKSYLQQVEANNKVANKHTADIKKMLKTQFEAYDKTIKAIAQESSSTLEKQARKLEKSVSEMVNEMLQKNTAALEAASAAASTMFTVTEQQISSDCTQLTTVHGKILDSTIIHCRTLDGFASEVHSSNSATLDKVSTMRDATDGTLAGISDTVGTKRKFLDTTVTTLVGEVDRAIAQSCQSVDATSETANKTLKDVSGAANKMSKSAAGAMSSFTQYLSQDGQAISSGLSAHFSATSQHLSSQSKGLDGITESAQLHTKTVSSIKAIPTAGAPTRDTLQPLRERPLRMTRSHALIIDEVKTGSWNPSTASDSSVSGSSLQESFRNSISSASVTVKKKRNVKNQHPLNRLYSHSLDEVDRDRELQIPFGNSSSLDSMELSLGENVPPGTIGQSFDGYANIQQPGKRLTRSKAAAMTTTALAPGEDTIITEV